MRVRTRRRYGLRVFAALTLAVLLPGLQASLVGVLPLPAVANAAELSAQSYIQTRDQLLGAIPADPVAAAKQLVAQVLGPDDAVAQVATIELLRQAGIPTINIDAYIVAMPSDGVIGDGPMIGEFLARLTRSVRNGDFYSMQDVAYIFEDSGAATAPIPPDLLLAGMAEWGKLPDAPRESIVAGTAVRALGAARGEPLFPGMDPLQAHVDLLQFTLLYLHLVGRASQVVTTAMTPARTQAGLLGPSVARADDDCRVLYDFLQLKPLQGKSPGATLGNAAFKEAFFSGLEEEYGAEAASQAKSALRYVDIASKAVNLIVFLTSIQLKIETSTSKTHFRHVPSDTSHDVTAVATAEWKQGETAQQLRCLQGIAGIETHANGPLPGFLVRWRLEEAKSSARVGKLLRPKADQASKFSANSSGGDTTNAAGQSTVVLEPAVERQPGLGALLSGTATIYANLDKNLLPDALKAFLGNKTFLTDYLKQKVTAWPKFLFDQLYDISLKAIQRAGMPVQKINVTVEYHGADAYLISGVRHPFLVFFSTTIDINAYTCEGLSGRWHGNVKFSAEKSLAKIFEQVGVSTGLPNSTSMSGTIDSILDLRGKSDTLVLSEPFRLKVSVDESAIERGYYGNVGDAGVIIESQSLEPFMFFDPTPDLPVLRLSKDNTNDLDTICPNNESYFP